MKKRLLYLGFRPTKNPDYYIGQFYDPIDHKTAGILFSSDVLHPDDMIEVEVEFSVSLGLNGLTVRAVGMEF